MPWQPLTISRTKELPPLGTTKERRAARQNLQSLAHREAGVVQFAVAAVEPVVLRLPIRQRRDLYDNLGRLTVDTERRILGLELSDDWGQPSVV